MFSCLKKIFAPNKSEGITLSKSKGFAHAILLLVLVVGLGAGIYLVGQKTNFLPKASMLRTVSGPISGPINTTPTSSPILSCTGRYTSGKSINWTVAGNLGTGISYSWNVGPVTGQSGFGANTTVSYGDCGAKTASVKVTKNGASQTVNCPAVTVPTTACSATSPAPTTAPQGGCTACSADVNKDKIVNISDFSLEKYCQGQRVDGPCSSADTNGDRTINQTDLNCVNSRMGQRCGDTTSSAKRVFITSTRYNGNLGGLTGADIKCQERATVAKLDGKWKAWLSDSRTSVASRFSQSNLPYKLLNGAVIADNWRDLTDGALRGPINVNEFNSMASGTSWTNTNPVGQITSSNLTASCNNWTSNNSSNRVNNTMGDYRALNYTWTMWNSGTFCNVPQTLYCFEQ